MLAIVTTAIAIGHEVTPEQALQRAKKFMESHETTVNKQKRAAGKTPSLSMASRESGSYIFNVDNDGGFIVVSNSERTVPILGFSETGSFDPDNIPDNMRAWPTQLTVNYNGGPTAEVRWTSEESVFDIDVNGTVTENVSNPYTLNDLEAATTYTVKVRAKNGNQVSEWSAPVTFTTEVSFDLCQITLELTDSYGDGWNGNAIQVVDVLTGTILATLQNTEEADAYQSQIYSVDVPNDHDINFIWVSGDYSGECSYIVYDVNGEVIFSGSGALSEPYTYHVNCTFAPKPQNLAVTPALSTATVSWTGNDNTTSYNLRYRRRDRSQQLQDWIRRG